MSLCMDLVGWKGEVKALTSIVLGSLMVCFLGRCYVLVDFSGDLEL